MVLWSVLGIKEGASRFERAHFSLGGGKICTFGCRIGTCLFDSLRALSSSLGYDMRMNIEAKFRGFHAFLRDSVATLRLVEVDEAVFRSGHTDQWDRYGWPSYANDCIQSARNDD